MTRTFQRRRGFLTFAQNSPGADYLRMAYALALSLKASQSSVRELTVVVTPGTAIPAKYRLVFDDILDVPWLDEARDSVWKLENEWKAFHVTPYEETIKLDADMLFPADIADWWAPLARHDLCAATTVESYRGEVVASDACRKVFTANTLPNVYSGFLYFKCGGLAHEVFELVEIIFHNWEKFAFDYLEPAHRPKQVSTDVALALAVKLLGLEDEATPPPGAPTPRFVHMKSQLQNWPADVDEDWTRHVPASLLPDLQLKVGLYAQRLPFHYQQKHFLTDLIIQTYEKALGL